ncbi:MAG TPA: hypothetical protein VFC57_07355, partial [Aeromicrobium sp.]|nr:hypothetical protein [Aeromicrobium sp.]
MAHSPGPATADRADTLLAGVSQMRHVRHFANGTKPVMVHSSGRPMSRLGGNRRAPRAGCGAGRVRPALRND